MKAEQAQKQKIVKKYVDSTVLVFNPNRGTVSYYFNSMYRFTILFPYSEDKFLHSELAYEKIKGVSEAVECTEIKHVDSLTQ